MCPAASSPPPHSLCHSVRPRKDAPSFWSSAADRQKYRMSNGRSQSWSFHLGVFLFLLRGPKSSCLFEEMLGGQRSLAALKWDRSQRDSSVYSCRYNFPWILCVCCRRKNPWPVERRLPAQCDIEQGEHRVGTREKENLSLHHLNVFIQVKHSLYIMYFMYSLHPGTGDVSGTF